MQACFAHMSMMCMFACPHRHRRPVHHTCHINLQVRFTWKAIVQMLMGMSDLAEREPLCLPFHTMLAQTISQASDELGADDLSRLHALFLSELSHVTAAPPSARPSAPPPAPGADPPDSDDAASDDRLCGHLRLLTALWLTLTKRAGEAPQDVQDALSSADFVRLLLDRHLFPEADVCARLRSGPDAILSFSVDDLQVRIHGFDAYAWQLSPFAMTGLHIGCTAVTPCLPGMN